MILRLAVLLLCTACCYSGEDCIRYYVFDETKTDKVHYVHTHNLTVWNLADRSPSLTFNTRYDILGCASNTFTYTVEDCQCEVPRELYDKLLAAVRQISLDKLSAKAKPPRETEPLGWIEFDGKSNDITVRLDNPERAKLHTLMLGLLDKVAPKATRHTVTRSTEGDHLPARPMTFATLLKNPKAYDGKRIRLVGFHHYEFEDSHLGPAKGSDLDNSVWLGGDSSFASPEAVIRYNDAFISVEGTFDAVPMLVRPGTLGRVTKITRQQR